MKESVKTVSFPLIVLKCLIELWKSDDSIEVSRSYFIEKYFIES